MEIVKDHRNHFNAYCPLPIPLFERRRPQEKSNEINETWVFLNGSGSKFETVHDDSKYTLPEEPVTYLLGFRAPATYYLSLALVFTLIRVPRSTSRPAPFYLGTNYLLPPYLV